MSTIRIVMGLAHGLGTLFDFIQNAAAAWIPQLNMASVTDRVQGGVIFPVVVFAAAETIVHGKGVAPGTVPNVW